MSQVWKIQNIHPSKFCFACLQSNEEVQKELSSHISFRQKIIQNILLKHVHVSLPADANIVPIMAFFSAVIRSSSAITDLYDSSLYLTAASMNFLL